MGLIDTDVVIEIAFLVLGLCTDSVAVIYHGSHPPALGDDRAYGPLNNRTPRSQRTLVPRDRSYTNFEPINALHIHMDQKLLKFLGFIIFKKKHGHIAFLG